MHFWNITNFVFTCTLWLCSSVRFLWVLWNVIVWLCATTNYLRHAVLSTWIALREEILRKESSDNEIWCLLLLNDLHLCLVQERREANSPTDSRVNRCIRESQPRIQIFLCIEILSFDVVVPCSLDLSHMQSWRWHWRGWNSFLVFWETTVVWDRLLAPIKVFPLAAGLSWITRTILNTLMNGSKSEDSWLKTYGRTMHLPPHTQNMTMKNVLCSLVQSFEKQ